MATYSDSEERIRARSNTETAVAVAAVIILVIVCSLVLNHAAAADPTSPTGPTVQIGQPKALTCADSHVRAHDFNNARRRLYRLTGHRPPGWRSKPVTRCAMIRVRHRIRIERRNCNRTKQVVTASTFGTSSGDDNGVGYQGDDLFKFNDSFAELSNPGTMDFCALGCLKPYAKRWVHYARRVLRGVKRDVGKGGPGLRGTIRGIDLHATFARRLGFGGLGIVTLTRRPCVGAF